MNSSETTRPPTAGSTYSDAGVDFDAADEAKHRIAALASTTHGPEVLGGVGGFGGLFELSGYRNPVLVSGTDNVGTKLKIAMAIESYEGLGEDVVNACVNDIITTGAKPLFFLDYIATGKMDADLVESLVRGITKACIESECALIGGETSELPGVFDEGEFDLSGFAVGAVEKDEISDPSTIAEGDVLVGIPSTGLHTNGFSLARHVLGVDEDPSQLFEHHSELGRRMGDALLEPHRAYYPVVKPALPHIKAMAHITGGGLVDNVPRVLPDGLGAKFDSTTWPVLPVFTLLQEMGGIDIAEMYHVFNMGLGMVLVCDESEAATIRDLIPDARTVGEVVRAGGENRVIL